jgi:hypothetical protein
MDQDVAALHDAIGGCALTPLTAFEPDRLADRVRGLRAAVTRLEAEVARSVQAANRAEVWRASGASSMDAWLADETKMSARAARSQVRLADTLAASPTIAEKMAEGSLTVENALALSSVVQHQAFAGDANALVELAADNAPAATRRALEHWRSMVDADHEPVAYEQQRSQRHLTFRPAHNGMVDVSGMLMPEDAATVKTALDHIAGASWNDETGRAHGARVADAFVELCAAYSRGEVQGGRERPKVVAVVPFETLCERAAARGVVVGHDDLGTLSASALRRLSCDAGIHRMITKGTSVVLDFGSATRLCSEAQFLAMAARDGGCRWPGCSRPAGWCDAHHVDEVVRDNGPTSVRNMVLLCSTHHALVHTLAWSLVGDAESLQVQMPNGSLLDAPPRGLSELLRPRQLSMAGEDGSTMT